MTRLQSLLRVSAALNIGVNDLFDVTTPKGRVVRRVNRRALEYPDIAARDEWISAVPGSSKLS
jgi:hypothetical protein